VPKERLVLEGRFKLLRHLGGGGMSEVYLAEQRSLGREVALKVLKRDLGADGSMAERFKREAQLLSTVDHPSVVRVIDFASGRDGTVLVLEYAPGETLEQALAEGPMEPRRAMRLLAQLAEGLSAIHQKGIVHRDIKPHNVVISQTPRGEVARLLDFGIARLMEIPDLEGVTGSPGAAGPFVSQVGQAVGTPAYVAPEQATASAVDARTDVYAFGVLAFRMLAGRLPFDGPTTRDYLEQHVRQAPPELDVVAPALKAWPELVRLVRQCLQKPPEARPADGRALAERLHRLVPSDIPLTTQSRRALGALTTQTWNSVQARAGTLSQQSVERMREAAELARGVPHEVRRSALITAGVAAVVGLGVLLWPGGLVERVRRQLDRGQPQEALTAIDASLAQAKGEVPALLALKVVALHRLGRHDAEKALLGQAPFEVVLSGETRVLEALAEESASEDDARVRLSLELMPRAWALPVYQRLSEGPPAVGQWGALRWLDRQQAVSGGALVQGYAKSLASKDCGVRRLAAVRLGELGDAAAVGPLRELSETPKPPSPTGGTLACGQDEAAEALRAVKQHQAR
jgi:hypothetical protein